jgi:hypothetical protein
MRLRVVGAISAILGICIVALAVGEVATSKRLAAEFAVNGHAWNLPVSRDVFLVRSRLAAGAVALSGLLTTIAGLGIMYGKGWGLYVETMAALLILAFPPVSRLFFIDPYAFDGPDLVDCAVASLIGLSASLAFIFRARRS